MREILLVFRSPADRIADARNTSHAEAIATMTDRLGMRIVVDHIQNDIADRHQVADRMENCPYRQA